MGGYPPSGLRPRSLPSAAAGLGALEGGEEASRVSGQEHLAHGPLVRGGEALGCADAVRPGLRGMGLRAAFSQKLFSHRFR